jgi:hypothetical protein
MRVRFSDRVMVIREPQSHAIGPARSCLMRGAIRLRIQRGNSEPTRTDTAVRHWTGPRFLRVGTRIATEANGVPGVWRLRIALVIVIFLLSWWSKRCG